MDIIVTHEITDFDGLAAMIAAQKLYEDARPVFVGRLQQTVKDFMALYRDEITVYNLKDIDLEEIKRVIIVDTCDNRRLGELYHKLDWDQVEVIVYDHHPHKTPDWVNLDLSQELGAAATILINRISAEEQKLNPLEATVCALGIYADTGNFTHLNTTPEDVRALAYLIENGANMKIINDFLNDKLNSEQQEIMEKLMKHRHSLKIDGIDISIFSLKNNRYVAGLNQVTEKLMSFYYLSVIFTIVEMEEKVQIIGRSSDEAVDMGKICGLLGGGGHSGAGAVQLKMGLEKSRKKLLETIRANVQPVIKISEIMSTPVKTISPTTTISEAEQVMEKFGHNGLVVTDQDHKIKGIFSRRDLDKVKEHNLMHAPVKGYMSDNVITINKNDSVQEAQQLMVKYNIGRLPVLKNGKLAGIITRSDVISTYHPQQSPYQYQNRYGSSLVNIKPQIINIKETMERLPDNVIKIFRKMGNICQDNNSKIYLIGGMVRDLLLGRENNDLDFVVEGNLKVLLPVLGQKLDGEWNYNEEFQTGNISLHSGYNLDLATSRKEHYSHSGALPEVEEADIFEDLFRRDYTVNALALMINPGDWGQLLDFFKGRRDLKKKLLRVLHKFSFLDDPTRIIRGIRLALKLEFDFEKETTNLMKEALQMGDYSRMSTTRVFQEFKILLKEYPGSPERFFEILKKIPVFKLIKYDFEIDKQVLKRWQKLEYYLDYFRERNYNIKEWLLRLVVLIDKLPKQIVENCSLTETEKNFLIGNLETNLSGQLDTSDPLKIVQILENLSPEELIFYLTKTEDCAAEKVIKKYIENYAEIEPEINGYDLQELGIKPGPRIRKILNKVYREKLKGNLENRRQELKFVRDLIEDKEESGN